MPRSSAAAIAARRLRLAATVDPLEILDHRAALFGCEAAQLVPRRLPELHGIAPACISLRRHALSPLRRLRLALAVLVALILLQRPTRVEHAAEELLLSLDRRRIDASGVERLRDALRLACEILRLPGHIAEPAEVARDTALLLRELARHLLRLRRAHSRLEEA